MVDKAEGYPGKPVGPGFRTTAAGKRMAAAYRKQFRGCEEEKTMDKEMYHSALANDMRNSALERRREVRRMGHTKGPHDGPWETPGTDGEDRVISYRDKTGKRRTLAHVYGQTETERDARALLIIRAVNAFEPMAAALNRLVSDLTYLCAIDCTGPNPPLNIGDAMARECAGAVEMARAAIEKAENAAAGRPRG